MKVYAMLDELLKYHQEPEPGDFTRQVMGKIRKPDRTRSIILWVSGAIGCIFGIGGMVVLNGSVAQFASVLLQQGPLGAPLIGVAAGLVLFGWFLNEGFE